MPVATTLLLAEVVCHVMSVYLVRPARQAGDSARVPVASGNAPQTDSSLGTNPQKDSIARSFRKERKHPPGRRRQ